MNRHLEKYAAELSGRHNTERLRTYASRLNEHSMKLTDGGAGGGDQDAGRNRKQSR